MRLFVVEMVKIITYRGLCMVIGGMRGVIFGDITDLITVFIFK